MKISSTITLAAFFFVVAVFKADKVTANCWDVKGDLASTWKDDLSGTEGTFSNGNLNGDWEFSFATNMWTFQPTSNRFCDSATLQDQFLLVDPEVAGVSKGSCDDGTHDMTIFVSGFFNSNPFDEKLGNIGCYDCRFWGKVCETA